MKLIEGGSLAQQIANGEFQIANEQTKQTEGKFDIRRSALLISKVARAVHYAHQRGVLHRDLKPHNILLDLQGQPHLSDFGLAKLAERDTGLTVSEAVMGSPAYMAPEQAAGGTKHLTTDCLA